MAPLLQIAFGLTLRWLPRGRLGGRRAAPPGPAGDHPGAAAGRRHRPAHPGVAGGGAARAARPHHAQPRPAARPHRPPRPARRAAAGGRDPRAAGRRRCSPARWWSRPSSACPASAATSSRARSNRDYTLVMGTVVLVAVLVIVLNLVGRPRLRRGSTRACGPTRERGARDDEPGRARPGPPRPRPRTAMAALAVLRPDRPRLPVGRLLTGHEPDADLSGPPPAAGRPRCAAAIRRICGPALERLAFRMRVKLEAVAARGRHPAPRPCAPTRAIDRRSLAYLPRSDLFGAAATSRERDDGRRLASRSRCGGCISPSAPTCTGATSSRRSLVAGRVSLLIGLVATCVALAHRRRLRRRRRVSPAGRVDAVMMRLVDVLYALPFVFFVIVLLVFFRAEPRC